MNLFPEIRRGRKACSLTLALSVLIACRFFAVREEPGRQSFASSPPAFASLVVQWTSPAKASQTPPTRELPIAASATGTLPAGTSNPQAPTFTDLPTTAVPSESTSTVTPSSAATAATFTVPTPLAASPTGIIQPATQTLAPTTFVVPSPSATATATQTGSLPTGGGRGEVLFVSRAGITAAGVLMRMRSDGSPASNLRSPPLEGITPAISPDGIKVAFVSNDDARIYIADLEGSAAPKRLTSAGGSESSPVWSPDGNLIAYLSINGSETDLFVTPSDGSGTPVNLSASVQIGSSLSAPSWNPNGSQLTFRSYFNPVFRISVINIDGTGHRILASSLEPLNSPVWSPDGSRIAYQGTVQGISSIFTVNPDGNLPPTQLTTGDSIDSEPRWSPDSSRILFTSQVGGNFDVFVINADGTGLLNLSASPGVDLRPRWSPDGTVVAFVSNRDGNLEVYRVNLDGTQLLRLTNSPASDDYPTWRP